jgi:hypothetical protein
MPVVRTVPQHHSLHRVSQSVNVDATRCSGFPISLDSRLPEEVIATSLLRAPAHDAWAVGQAVQSCTDPRRLTRGEDSMAPPPRKASAAVRSREAKQFHERGDLDQIAPAVQPPVDVLQHDGIARVEGAIATWMHALQMMRSFDRKFAAELMACRTAYEATTVCNQWVAHRIDSLTAVRSHLFEIWLTCSSRLPLRQHVSCATEDQPNHAAHN